MTAMTASNIEVGTATEEPKDTSSATSKLSKAAEEVSFIVTGLRKGAKRTKFVDDGEPLVDTTAALTLKSKKTARAQKRIKKKQKKAAERPAILALLDLPPELLQEVFSYLRPKDIFQTLLVSHDVHDFILDHENAICRDIIKRRYWVLSRCFPLPVAFEDVDSSAHPSLLSEKRQDMLQIHKKPYQHVKGVDPLKICTCVSCVFAWNNLCLILDLSHWQKNLNEREPIPMIARGTSPAWNRALLDTNAAAVLKAMTSRLCYARILEKHLQTTVQTISRTLKGKKTVHPRRVYYLTPAEAAKENDEFLEREGPHSYEFLWHRDNYYNLETYVPNRKWSKEKERTVHPITVERKFAG